MSLGDRGAIEVPNAPGKDALRFTRTCRYFSSGRCQYGDRCMFAHSKETLRHAPPYLYKTKVCELYQIGCCRDGVYCNYAHSQDELKSRRSRRAAEKGESGSVHEESVADSDQPAEWVRVKDFCEQLKKLMMLESCSIDQRVAGMKFDPTMMSDHVSTQASSTFMHRIEDMRPTIPLSRACSPSDNGTKLQNYLLNICECDSLMS